MKIAITLILLSLYQIQAIAQIDSLQHDSSASQGLVEDTSIVLGSEDIESTHDSIKYFSEELAFVTYLITNEQYDDASLLLERLGKESSGANANQIDSIKYIRGWIQYFDRDFPEAISILSTVSDSFNIGKQADFYRAICYVYLEDYETARNTLADIDLDSTSQLWELRQLQYGAIALLNRDYELFDTISNSFTERHFEFANEERSMRTYHEQLSTYKRKSPWIAGFLSALFPGIGKFYSGYRGTPLGTMYMTLPLAAVAIEAAILAGVASVPFIVLGSLFGIFYIGNIWGSALSVYSIQREIYDEIDHNIRFDMHIPLRRVFWQ